MNVLSSFIIGISENNITGEFFYRDLALFLLFFAIWELLMSFFILVAINGVLAKIFNIQVGNIVLLTAISYIVSILLFHSVNYYIFYTGDPLNMKTLTSIEYLDRIVSVFVLANETESNFLSFESFIALIMGVFTLIFYKEVFIYEPTVNNYILLYIFASSNQDLWFWFYFDYIFIFIIYIIIFTVMFKFVVKSCSCELPDYLDDTGIKREIGRKKVVGQVLLDEPYTNSDLNIDKI